jgi:hypothetical protein
MRCSGDMDAYPCLEWGLNLRTQCSSGIRASTCFEYFLNIVHFNVVVVKYFLFWKQRHRLKSHLRNTLATIVCPSARCLSQDVPADVRFIWNISAIFSLVRKAGHMCISN